MLTHIVWWTMKPEAEGNTGEENARIIKKNLEGLKGRIPTLLDLCVGVKVLPTATEEAQLVLVTKHENADGLKAYADHPEHVKALDFIKKVVNVRKAIDFED